MTLPKAHELIAGYEAGRIRTNMMPIYTRGASGGALHQQDEAVSPDFHPV
jgi:hypothetical protein